MAEQESSTAQAPPANWDPERGDAERKVNGARADRNPHQAYVSQVQDPNAPRPHLSTVSQVSRPEFMKLANPGPLGLLAFAITTFIVGLYECGAGLPNSNPQGNVGPNQASFGTVVFMGGTAQVLAGLMEFRVGNTFGATLHTSYGAFWLSYGMFSLPEIGIKAAYNGDMRAYSFALGIYLIMWGFLTFLFLLAALKTNVAILLVLFFLFLAYFFLSLANFTLTEHATASLHLNKTGGAFAVICAACAFYAGASGLMQPETTWIRFPLGEIPVE
ncbi:hypothetical protein N7474_003815 [Penicillium riverlandense]|uniref:uncharacterized protein n=1 Tax=Penicillium riverlandense TaxID=1903569 RepID=UPI0025488B1D|nr:uncharacterized protein N7474_003815 [Penicillium riverlandense]KAJ5818224.1 hypothetical protein N7474_003815 [Penicillium riverlandense]